MKSKKNVLISIILLVIILAVIAGAVALSLTMGSNSDFSIKSEGNIDNLGVISQRLCKKLGVDKDNIRLYKDSDITIEGDIVTDMNWHVIISKDDYHEYWEITKSEKGYRAQFKESASENTGADVRLYRMTELLPVIKANENKIDISAVFSVQKHLVGESTQLNSYYIAENLCEKIETGSLNVDSYLISVNEGGIYYFS